MPESGDELQNNSDADLALAVARKDALSASNADRRRPGRWRRVSPELVPLLRGEPESSSTDRAIPEQNFGDPDQLRAARGLAAGVSISLMLWAGLIAAAYRLLR